MQISDVENFDASGNLYGFLDDMDVRIGSRAWDDRGPTNAEVGYNFGFGSSAQLVVYGSERRQHHHRRLRQRHDLR